MDTTRRARTHPTRSHALSVDWRPDDPSCNSLHERHHARPEHRLRRSDAAGRELVHASGAVYGGSATRMAPYRCGGIRAVSVFRIQRGRDHLRVAVGTSAALCCIRPAPRAPVTMGSALDAVVVQRRSPEPVNQV